MIGLGLSITQLAVRQLVGQFNPMKLFALGEQGAWYDPSDLSTLFQDAAGTTAVTAVEQPVGLMLDKSKGLVLGPELVVNGDFSSGTTGWNANDSTLSIVGGKLRVDTDVDYGRAFQLISFVAGKSYLVKATVTAVAGDATTSIQFSQILDSGGGGAFGISSTGVGSREVSFYWTAPETRTYALVLQNNNTSPNSVNEFDNVSVRELPGNHAFQTTATSRPVLSARVNLLTKTEQFDDAAWGKINATVVADVTVAPDGAGTADALFETAATGFHSASPPSTVLASASGQSYTLSFHIKTNGRNMGFLSIVQGGGFCTFDIADQTIVFGGNGTNETVTAQSITAMPDGWFLLSMTSSFSGVVNVRPTLGIVSDTGASSYPGDVSKGLYIWGASLVPANQADLPYQRVNTATDYDSDPTKFPRFLRCDGIDDWMVTGTITPGTDKAQVITGVRKLSTSTAIIAEFSTTAGTSNGSFGVYGPDGTFQYTYLVRGTANSIAQTAGSTYAAPITNVLTGLGDISGDRATLRIDGTQVAQSTADQGTGNFNPYPLYLFRRGGTTLPFNGHFYGGIIRFGDNLPIETIEQTEAWMAAKTGVTL